MINPNGLDLDNMSKEDFDEVLGAFFEVFEDMASHLDSETIVGAGEYRERITKAIKEHVNK